MKQRSRLLDGPTTTDQAVEERLQAILCGILQQDGCKIPHDTILLDIPGLTSLAIVTLLLSIEQEFAMTIRNSEVSRLVLFGDVVKLVETKLQN